MLAYQRHELHRCGWSLFVIELALNVKFCLGVLLGLFPGFVVIATPCIAFLHLAEEFLSMRADLRPRSGLHIILNLLPILAILHNRYNKN